jgi:hypothetical protein
LTFLLRTIKNYYQRNRITYITNVNFTSMYIILASLILLLCAVYNSSLNVLPKDGMATCRLYCHITDWFCRSVVFCDPNYSYSRLSTTLYTSAFTNLLFDFLPERSSFHSRIQWLSHSTVWSVNGSVLERFSLNGWSMNSIDW